MSDENNIVMSPAPEGFAAVRRPRVPPSLGEVEIAVRHVGVCFGDILIANRARSSGKKGVVPGMETAGVVTRVGSEDSTLKVGQRVVAYGTSGGYASHVVRRVNDVFPLPNEVETSEAVALPVNYVTALQSLRMAGASEGQTLFFNAASGGVGTAIADLAREQRLHAVGAASARKHERLRQLDVTPVDPEGAPFDAELAKVSVSGIDLALDGLGLGWEKRCMSLVRPSGKVVSYGIRGVGTGGFPFAKVMFNQLSFVLGGLFSRRTARLYILELSRRRRPAEYRADMQHLIELVRRRRLRPIIAAEIPLERASDAHRALAARDLFGKAAEPVNDFGHVGREGGASGRAVTRRLGRRTSLILVALTAYACGGPSMSFPNASKPYFPAIRVENLNGAPSLLPSELPGERSLILVAFTQEQQRSVDTWVEGMNLSATDIAWIELPVIDNPGAIGRWFVDNGMRRGITDREARERVFTLYTDRAGFLKAMGIDDAREVVALVVDRGGQILARHCGSYTAEKAATLSEVLRERL